MTVIVFNDLVSLLFHSQLPQLFIAETMICISQTFAHCSAAVTPAARCFQASGTAHRSCCFALQERTGSRGTPSTRGTLQSSLLCPSAVWVPLASNIAPFPSTFPNEENKQPPLDGMGTCLHVPFTEQVVSGGVAANQRIRRGVTEVADSLGRCFLRLGLWVCCFPRMHRGDFHSLHCVCFVLCTVSSVLDLFPNAFALMCMVAV